MLWRVKPRFFLPTFDKSGNRAKVVEEIAQMLDMGERAGGGGGGGWGGAIPLHKEMGTSFLFHTHFMGKHPFLGKECMQYF